MDDIGVHEDNLGIVQVRSLEVEDVPQNEI
jgi:hypothetical protein